MTLLTLMAGVASGMTITALAPSTRADRATPWAWLPAEQATTPRERREGGRDDILL